MISAWNMVFISKQHPEACWPSSSNHLIFRVCRVKPMLYQPCISTSPGLFRAWSSQVWHGGTCAQAPAPKPCPVSLSLHSKLSWAAQGAPCLTPPLGEFTLCLSSHKLFLSSNWRIGKAHKHPKPAAPPVVRPLTSSPSTYEASWGAGLPAPLTTQMEMFLSKVCAN